MAFSECNKLQPILIVITLQTSSIILAGIVNINININSDL